MVNCVVFPLISLCPSVVLTVLYLLNRRYRARNTDLRSPSTTSTEEGGKARDRDKSIELKICNTVMHMYINSAHTYAPMSISKYTCTYAHTVESLSI